MQKIRLFAAFRDYFDEEIELASPVCSVAGLKQALLKLNPECSELLGTARFAIDHQFINEDRSIEQYESIYIIPPSGGG